MKAFAIILLAILMTSAAGQNRGQHNWPSFRGPNAAGIADGQNLPERWDGEKGTNILWKAPIPGLAHSSPVVWGDRVFVSTAVSSRGDAKFKPGLYGDGDASEDRSPQKWRVLCLDSGSYMPTPLIYREQLYVIQNQGILSCYELSTGQVNYTERIPHQGSGFSASPVAADGLIYLSSEDGDMFVVRAGAKFELVGKTPMGQLLTATPAV